MSETMDQCELSLGDAGEFFDDLGLTLSPGSQSQPFAPAMDFSAFDISVLDNFDPLTDFDPLVHQIDIPDLDSSSGKRAFDETFPSEPETETSPPKRTCQSLASPSPSPSIESLALQTQQRMELANNSSNLTAAHDSSSAAPCNPASTGAKARFGLSPEDIERHAANIPATQASKPFSSPYGLSRYYPSASFLHPRTVSVEVSHSSLQHRLKNSHRRISVLIAERNRYRDGLLSYTTPDPRTGKLRIDEMETEITTLRRVTSTQQTRTRQLKADVQSWQQRYADLATTHNRLVADYKASQESPSVMSRQPQPQNNIDQSQMWKLMYDKLLMKQCSIISALKAPGADPKQILESLSLQPNDRAPASYPSPASVSSLPTCPPAAPPKDAMVIDLTSDDAENVSTQGIPVTQPAPANGPPLTDFRRALRAKKLDWMQPNLDDQAAAQHLFESLREGCDSVPREPRRIVAPCPKRNGRKGGTDSHDDNLESNATWMRCYNQVQVNNQIRRSLGMTQPIRDREVQEIESSEDEGYNPTDEELAQMMEDQLMADSDTNI